jgi:hypothetical protein
MRLLGIDEEIFGSAVSDQSLRSVRSGAVRLRLEKRSGRCALDANHLQRHHSLPSTEIQFLANRHASLNALVGAGEKWN